MNNSYDSEIIITNHFNFIVGAMMQRICACARGAGAPRATFELPSNRNLRTTVDASTCYHYRHM